MWFDVLSVTFVTAELLYSGRITLLTLISSINKKHMRRLILYVVFWSFLASNIYSSLSQNTKPDTLPSCPTHKIGEFILKFSPISYHSMCLLLILYWNSMALNSTRKMWIYWNRVYFSDRHIQDGIYWNKNSYFNISIKSKSQGISTYFSQLIRNIFSVKKLDNYIPACNHFAGQVLNVGITDRLASDWLAEPDRGFLLVQNL